MNENKTRQSGFFFKPVLRESGDGKESRTIEGYAILFNERSEMLCDFWGEDFIEIMDPGSVTRELLNSCDIKMTMFHNREKILARSKNGKGTLRYKVDSKGVKFWFDAPNTALGDEAIELVKRGDLAGCSFMYTTNEDPKSGCVEYRKELNPDGTETLIRTVKKVIRIYDFTLAADPAYQQTSVDLRELEAYGITLKGAKREGWKKQVEEMKEAAHRDPITGANNSPQKKADWREQVKEMRNNIKQY